MAFQAGVSVSVLYRKLRSLTGITVHDFVKTIRMKKAMELLETGLNQVNEVATAVGYEDSKYFSKEFRKTFGKTPTEIKRNMVELE
jgi:AraC-like DNA-binding protein